MQSSSLDRAMTAKTDLPSFSRVSAPRPKRALGAMRGGDRNVAGNCRRRHRCCGWQRSPAPSAAKLGVLRNTWLYDATISAQAAALCPRILILTLLRKFGRPRAHSPVNGASWVASLRERTYPLPRSMRSLKLIEVGPQLGASRPLFAWKNPVSVGCCADWSSREMFRNGPDASMLGPRSCH